MWTRIVLVLAIGVCTMRIAHAYPQFQLSRDATCTGCHISPDGGGLLQENGENVAEDIAWKAHDARFMYGALDMPDWLQLGGDLRGATGFVQAQLARGAAYPMQAELLARAAAGQFSIIARGGLRQLNEDASAAHVVWSREHYAMWQQKPGAGRGLYARVGRFMPTFGLRLVEHPVYTNKYGGRPLYYEAYAAAISYVGDGAEVHVTAFAHDRIASTAEHGDGGAVYGEARLGDHAAIGAEAKVSANEAATHTFAGLTGKLYVPGADLLLLGEGQLIRDHIAAGAGDRATRLAAYVLASRPLPYGLLLDVGLGYYKQDTRVRGLSRDCIDANVHWFVDSHIELLITTRLEILDGGGGPNGGYALGQLHYRL